MRLTIGGFAISVERSRIGLARGQRTASFFAGVRLAALWIGVMDTSTTAGEVSIEAQLGLRGYSFTTRMRLTHLSRNRMTNF